MKKKVETDVGEEDTRYSTNLIKYNDYINNVVSERSRTLKKPSKIPQISTGRSGKGISPTLRSIESNGSTLKSPSDKKKDER